METFRRTKEKGKEVNITISKEFLNKIDDLYEEEIIDTPDGNYKCPVCNKKYTNRENCISHLEEKSCVDVKSLLKDTVIERQLYNSFNGFCSIYKNYKRYKLSSFRSYYLLSWFALYKLCLTYNIILSEYVSYIHLRVKQHYHRHETCNVQIAISYVLRLKNNHSFVIDFFEWRKYNREGYYLESFILSNKDKLKTDMDFLLQSLEKGEITYKYVEDHISYIVDNMTPAQLILLEKIFKNKKVL